VSQLPAALRRPQQKHALDFWNMYFVDFVVFYCCEIMAEGSLLWKHLGSIWRHPAGTQEALRRHPRGTQGIPGATWATLVHLAQKVSLFIVCLSNKNKKNK